MGAVDRGIRLAVGPLVLFVTSPKIDGEYVGGATRPEPDPCRVDGR